MKNQNEDKKAKIEKSRKEFYLVVKWIGYLLMIAASLIMFRSSNFQSEPFAFFGLGLVCYLIGKDGGK